MLTPELSRRDFIKALGAAGVALLVGCSEKEKLQRRQEFSNVDPLTVINPATGKLFTKEEIRFSKYHFDLPDSRSSIYDRPYLVNGDGVLFNHYNGKKVVAENDRYLFTVQGIEEEDYLVVKPKQKGKTWIEELPDVNYLHLRVISGLQIVDDVLLIARSRQKGGAEYIRYGANNSHIGSQVEFQFEIRALNINKS